MSARLKWCAAGEIAAGEIVSPWLFTADFSPTLVLPIAL
jgi:hypothetical protein